MSSNRIPDPDADFCVWNNTFVTCVNALLADLELAAGDLDDRAPRPHRRSGLGEWAAMGQEAL